MTPNNEQREQGHCMAQASDYFGIAMIIAERDKLKAQRDALLAAMNRANLALLQQKSYSHADEEAMDILQNAVSEVQP